MKYYNIYRERDTGHLNFGGRSFSSYQAAQDFENGRDPQFKGARVTAAPLMTEDGRMSASITIEPDMQEFLGTVAIP